jgi:hypothetical protein
MWISEIAERAIMQAMAGLDVTFRASRVDNEEDYPDQRKKYPCITIMASGGSSDSIESLFDRIDITVILTTHYEDDPKRTTLAALEDQFRKILDAKISVSTMKTSFDAVALAAGETRYFKGLTDIEGGAVEVTEKEQSISTTMTMHVCGS